MAHPDYLPLTSRQFTDWLAYDRIEPFGPWRGDVRAAVVAHAVARYAGDGEVELSDFIPKFDAAADEIPEEQQLPLDQKLKAMFGLPPELIGGAKT